MDSAYQQFLKHTIQRFYVTSSTSSVTLPDLHSWSGTESSTFYIESQLENGYVVTPSQRTIYYLKEKPGGGTWTVEEVAGGDTQGSWTYYGGGNCVGRPAWINTSTAEKTSRQWDYQNKLKKYDVVKIDGTDYICKIAKSIWRHISAYEYQDIPTDIDSPTDLNLSIEDRTGINVSARQFRCDWFQIWDSAGTLKTDIEAASSFTYISSCRVAPDKTFTVSLNGNNLTLNTDYAVNFATGVITLSDAVKSAITGTQILSVDYYAISRESFVIASTIKNIQAALNASDKVNIPTTVNGAVSFHLLKFWQNYLTYPLPAFGDETVTVDTTSPPTGYHAEFNWDYTGAFGAWQPYRVDMSGGLIYFPVNFLTALNCYGGSIISCVYHSQISVDSGGYKIYYDAETGDFGTGNYKGVSGVTCNHKIRQTTSSISGETINFSLRKVWKYVDSGVEKYDCDSGDLEGSSSISVLADGLYHDLTIDFTTEAQAYLGAINTYTMMYSQIEPNIKITGEIIDIPHYSDTTDGSEHILHPAFYGTAYQFDFSLSGGYFIIQFQLPNGVQNKQIIREFMLPVGS